jgi:hypothetical protein
MTTIRLRASSSDVAMMNSAAAAPAVTMTSSAVSP